MHLQSILVVLAAILGLSQSFQIFNVLKNKIHPISNLKVKSVSQWVEKTFNVDFKTKSAVFSWEDCGKDSDSVRVTSLTFDPASPNVGDVLTMVLNGRVNETISGEGEGVATLYFDGVEIQSKTLGVCELVQVLFPNAPCPPPAGTGDFAISTSGTVEEFPDVDGRLQIIFRGTHGSKSLFCFGFNVDLTSGATN